MAKESKRMTMANRLIEGMEKLNISANDLAERAGVAPSTVSGIFRQLDRNTRPNTLQKIAKALDMDPRYLTGRTDTPGSWSDFYRNNYNHLSEDSRSYDNKESERLAEFEIGPVRGDFGANVHARVLVDTQAEVRSGHLYLAELPGTGRRICYFVEPYLVWISYDGETQYTVRTPAIEVIGEVSS